MFGLHRFVCQEVLGNKLSGFCVVKCVKGPSRQTRFVPWTVGREENLGAHPTEQGKNIIVATLPPLENW